MLVVVRRGCSVAGLQCVVGVARREVEEACDVMCLLMFTLCFVIMMRIIFAVASTLQILLVVNLDLQWICVILLSHSIYQSICLFFSLILSSVFIALDNEREKSDKVVKHMLREQENQSARRERIYHLKSRAEDEDKKDTPS